MSSLPSQSRPVHSSTLNSELELLPHVQSNRIRDADGITHGRESSKLTWPEQYTNTAATRKFSTQDGTTNQNPRRGIYSPDEFSASLDRSDPSQPKHGNAIDETAYKAGAFEQFNIISAMGYRTEYYSTTADKLLQVNEIQRTFSADGLENRPAFEIVTIYNTPASKYDPSTNALLPLSGLNHKRIVIYSPAILKNLRSVVDYYPGYSLLGQPMTINEPYAILLHHLDQLEEKRAQYANSSDRNEVAGCKSEKDSYEHLCLLLDFLRKECYGMIEREEEGYRRATPVVNFDMLWLLLKPGTDVYCDQFAANRAPRYDAYVIKKIEGGTSGCMRTPYTVHLWYMDFNGDIIGRANASCVIHPFEGEKEITSLRVIPVDYMSEEMLGDSLPRQERVEKGKLFFNLTKSKLCMDYSGCCFDAMSSIYEGRVVIDFQAFYSQPERLRDGFEKLTLRIPDDTVSGAMLCYCEACKDAKGEGNQKRHSFSDYDGINPCSTSQLTDHQYFLLSRIIFGYGLESMRWESLDINYISYPRYDTEKINSLVAPEDYRILLKAVAKSFEQEDLGLQNSSYPSPTNFIQRKGQGKIVLLHGPPGVGKTYSAICVAEYVQRPLLKLACGDVGNNATDAERNLGEIFRRARSWGAILLIDEADVYLERRITQDLTRNALVSVLLRMFETYSGLLLLTTNRIGTFDDAFISRIHLVLHYHALQEKGREDIWRSCFNLLELERGDKITIFQSARDYAMRSEEVMELNLNGRDIKNAFQIALALADNSPKLGGKTVLNDTHIAYAVKKSKAFKSYLEKLHHGSEAKRAALARIRDDTATYEH